jgi:serine/threonine protein kinase
MLTPGAILQDRYHIVRLIRQGGMGAVYEAMDTRLSNKVALKETLFTDDVRRDAFQREACLLASLHHPMLPVVSDHFLDGDGQFLVMQYIPGDDLAEMLHRQGDPFPPSDVLRWTDQLLDVLEYLHSQQPPIIHRDIKPQNLKLRARGDIVLLDFGLAKGVVSQDSRLTAMQYAAYTPEYAPLEQILGEGAGFYSDIYSVGATVYFLLTGTPPPNTRIRAAALLDGQIDPLQRASELTPRVSPDIAHVLHDAMALRPEKRLNSPSAMRGALADAATGRPPNTGQAHGARSSFQPPSSAERPKTTDRLVCTVLFTDIVSSTVRGAAVGNAVWARLLDTHDTLVRKYLEQFHGQEIKQTGDGFLVSFDRPTQALRCARAILHQVHQIGIEIRAGLHMGECEVRGSDLTGVAVNFASRVMDQARPGEILVSRAVHDAVQGTGNEFRSCGRYVLKGFGDTHELFAVKQPMDDSSMDGPEPVRRSAVAGGSTTAFLRARLAPAAAVIGSILLGVAATVLALSMTGAIGISRGPGVGPLPVRLSAIPPNHPGGRELLYDADWTGGLAGWSGGPSWRVADGMLVSDVPRERSVILAPYRVEVPDYAVEADIQRTDNNEGSVSFAILARGDRGMGLGYWGGLHVGTGRSPAIQLEADAPRMTVLLMSRWFDPGQEWHRYRVEVRGSNIRMFSDDVLWLDVVDERYRAGPETGLWSWGTQIKVKRFSVMKI